MTLNRLLSETDLQRFTHIDAKGAGGLGDMKDEADHAPPVAIRKALVNLASAVVASHCPLVGLEEER